MFLQMFGALCLPEPTGDHRSTSDNFHSTNPTFMPFLRSGANPPENQEPIHPSQTDLRRALIKWRRISKEESGGVWLLSSAANHWEFGAIAIQPRASSTRQNRVTFTRATLERPTNNWNFRSDEAPLLAERSLKLLTNLAKAVLSDSFAQELARGGRRCCHRSGDR